MQGTLEKGKYQTSAGSTRGRIQFNSFGRAQKGKIGGLLGDGPDRAFVYATRRGGAPGGQKRGVNYSAEKTGWRRLFHTPHKEWGGGKSVVRRERRDGFGGMTKSRDVWVTRKRVRATGVTGGGSAKGPAQDFVRKKGEGEKDGTDTLGGN